MTLKVNENTIVIAKVLVIMVFFYIAVMLVWNYSNTTHKPSNRLWDWRKEGYQVDPLYDRARDK
jgi:hypothetical protein